MVSLKGYQLKEQIHEGSSTLVYRGVTDENQQPVIVKLIKSEYPSNKEIDKFKREYEISRKLQFEGVVKALALEKNGNGLALITEDFGGISLKEIIQSKKISIQAFLKISMKIAETLGNIHKSDIIHKDIKPQNIIINSSTGDVRIIDFGISTLLSQENQKAISPDHLEGTLAYISPEQTGRMNRSIDYRTDFYSLGISLYEMLTGAPPFEAQDAMELVHCHIARQPQTPSEKNPDVPETLSDIVMKLLSKNAEDRYQTAAGLRYDLSKCLKLLNESGAITEFPLGSRDASGKMQIPQKLYGRENDTKNLLDAYQRVCNGTVELMLVAGYSGIGKSALINEIQKPIVESRGYFSSGKYDQFKRDVPYSAITGAFSGLIKEILTESEDRIATWKSNFLEALGPNAQVIVEIIPELEFIIGKQPAVQALPPSESQNRFNTVFQEFLGVLASQEHPLAIFLDDLQWIDSSSLNLLQVLMTNPDSRHLFFIGAFRDNEVDATHPLMLTMDEVKKSHIAVNTITLRPLEQNHVYMLVAESLGTDIASSEGLAKLVFDKTNGNPFFVTEFLKSLYNEKLLYFDPVEDKWVWDIDKIQNMGYTDNVVEFMSEKVQKLNQSEQEILQLASCTGHTFDLKTLSTIAEKNHAEVAQLLLPAVKEGLLVPLDSSAFQLVLADIGTESSEKASEGIGDTSFRFAHDRVQQATYTLIPEQDKQLVHLKVGRLMLADADEKQLEENIFDILSQLNSGADLITDASEQKRIAELNLTAGKKAKASNAYGPATHLFGTGAKLLKDGWKTDYETFYGLKLEGAEAEFLNGNLEEAEKLFDEVLANANNNYDKARVYEMLTVQSATAGLPEKAVDSAIAGLALLGTKLPRNPNLLMVLVEVIKSKVFQGRRKYEDLLDSPIMTDEKRILAAKILSHVTPSAYVTSQELFAVVVLKLVNLALRFGNAPMAAYAYGLYGVLLAQQFKLFNDGLRLAQLGIDLVEKLHDQQFKCKAEFVMGMFAQHWTGPMRNNIPHLKESILAGQRSGDIGFAAYSCMGVVSAQITKGDNLDMTLDVCDKYFEYIHQVKDAIMMPLFTIMRQYIRNQKGLTTDPDGFTDEEVEEKAFIQQTLQEQSLMGENWIHVYKQKILYGNGKYEEAIEQARDGAKTIENSLALVVVPEHNFYYSLACAAAYDKATSQNKRKYLKQIKKNQGMMKAWAGGAPENNEHKYLLVRAELARIQGRDTEAMDLYDQAIENARENEFLQNEALANELAAKYYMSRDKEKVARTYLTDARYGYLRWGGESKIQYLDKTYPEMMRKIGAAESVGLGASETTTIGLTRTETGGTSSLDLGTVMKASQTLSGEIFLEQLMQKMMKILIENAGAEKGYLLLEKEGKLHIEVEGRVDGAQGKLSGSTPLDNDDFLPAAMAQYVLRTGENVVLGDATKEGLFTKSSYVVENKPQSVLCIPIQKQGKAFGCIYLENNLTTNAFTPDRLEVLKILSTQAAISLENARLVAEETERQKLQKEMDIAKDLQMSILPIFPEDEAYNITAHMTPAESVGGDYYDFYPVNGHRWIAIGDVTGHGLNSGLLMLMAQTGFSTYLNSTPNPDTLELFAAVNRTLCDNMQTRTKQGLYMTFTAMKSDSEGNFEHVGKHEDILVYRKATGKVEIIESEGFWMGVVPEVKDLVHKSNFKLNSGDFITLFTDGVIECRNKAGEQYDTSRLIQVIEENANEGIEKVQSEIVRTCKEFMDIMDDDITLFLMQKK